MIHSSVVGCMADTRAKYSGLQYRAQCSRSRKLRASTELDGGRSLKRRLLAPAPIHATPKRMWGEQKPETVSLSLD
jgi:hypothetical protein